MTIITMLIGWSMKTPPSSPHPSFKRFGLAETHPKCYMIIIAGNEGFFLMETHHVHIYYFTYKERLHSARSRIVMQSNELGLVLHLHTWTELNTPDPPRSRLTRDIIFSLCNFAINSIFFFFFFLPCLPA